MLDSHYYIYSERFLRHQKDVIEKFLRESTRAPAHAGSVYKAEAAELKVQLDGFFTAPQGPGLPSRENRARTPKAIVAPHIDFQRGGPVYAWAYKSLAESDGADLYIILGTSHWSGEKSFVLTYKDFFTPFGPVETDRDFTRRLQERCKDDLFADEYLHRSEHSLEFQVVFLKYIAQRRAELSGQVEKPFKIVPILVSSFHPMLQSRTLPENSPAVKTFLNAVQELVGQEKRQVCFVAGVDLAHVGRQFGDREAITTDFLKWVEEEDSRLMERLAALDAPGFFHQIAKDHDRRRVCGFSPLYSLIHLLDGARSRHIKYSQAFTPETGSAVTFMSMVFD